MYHFNIRIPPYIHQAPHLTLPEDLSLSNIFITFVIARYTNPNFTEASGSRTGKNMPFI